MEDTNVQDTPENANVEPSQAFDAPIDAGQDSSGELSVDDIILGNVDDTAPAFGQPAPKTVPGEAKNDSDRYQYWHSKSAKLENELNGIKSQAAQAQQQQMAMAQQQMMAQQQQAAQPEQQQFPGPPEKPNKPRNYSREEAYSDSGSESARYLDEVEEWRDNIEEYKDLRHQYDIVLADKRKALQKTRLWTK
jgi:hypothetical protein